MLSCTKHSGLTKQKQLALSRHKAAVPRYETQPTGAHPIDPNKANRSPINPTKAWCMAIGLDVLLAAHGSARTSSCASLSAGTLQRHCSLVDASQHVASTKRSRATMATKAQCQIQTTLQKMWVTADVRTTPKDKRTGAPLASHNTTNRAQIQPLRAAACPGEGV